MQVRVTQQISFAKHTFFLSKYYVINAIIVFEDFHHVLCISVCATND